jgi:predicted GNAT superfamily acetyltransferase
MDKTLPIAALQNGSYEQILALNNAHATETSPLDLVALSALVNQGFYARGIDGGRAAFLIALDQSNNNYASPNFLWFKARYQRYVYIDRVITAPEFRGQGLARRLYEDLFNVARASGQSIVGCEVNIKPPNPASDLFHEALGFQTVGEATIATGKTVRYMSRSLPAR